MVEPTGYDPARLLIANQTLSRISFGPEKLAIKTRFELALFWVTTRRLYQLSYLITWCRVKDSNFQISGSQPVASTNLANTTIGTSGEIRTRKSYGSKPYCCTIHLPRWYKSGGESEIRIPLYFYFAKVATTPSSPIPRKIWCQIWVTIPASLAALVLQTNLPP